MPVWKNNLAVRLAIQHVFQQLFGKGPSALLFGPIEDKDSDDTALLYAKEYLRNGPNHDFFEAESCFVVSVKGLRYIELCNCRLLSPPFRVSKYELAIVREGSIELDSTDQDMLLKRVDIVLRWGGLEVLPKFLYYTHPRRFETFDKEERAAILVAMEKMCGAKAVFTMEDVYNRDTEQVSEIMVVLVSFPKTIPLSLENGLILYKACDGDSDNLTHYVRYD